MLLPKGLGALPVPRLILDFHLDIGPSGSHPGDMYAVFALFRGGIRFILPQSDDLAEIKVRNQVRHQSTDARSDQIDVTHVIHSSIRSTESPCTKGQWARKNASDGEKASPFGKNVNFSKPR